MAVHWHSGGLTRHGLERYHNAILENDNKFATFLELYNTLKNECKIKITGK